MGYGIIKLPKLIIAQRSLKIRLNWAYFTVAKYEEMKFRTMYRLEEAIWIIEEFKKKMEGDNSKTFEFRLVKQIEEEIRRSLYAQLEKRGKNVKDLANIQIKFKKMEVNTKSIVALNELVRDRYFEYRMSCFNLEREVVTAIYFWDLIRATEGENRGRLDERWDRFYEKSFVFRLMPFMGKFF